MLFLGLSLAKNNGDVNIAGIVATSISLLPIVYTIFKIINSKNKTLKKDSFKKDKELNLKNFIVLFMLGILVYIIDNIIYIMIMSYTIFTKYGQ